MQQTFAQGVMYISHALQTMLFPFLHLFADETFTKMDLSRLSTDFINSSQSPGSKPVVIGIYGVSGSGKSTMLRSLEAKLAGVRI